MFGNQNMQNDGNKTIKMILAIGLVGAALLASAGVFYYYVVFVPKLEQQKLDLEKQKLEEKKDAEEKAQKKKELEADQRAQAYQNCTDQVESTYTENWGNACQKMAERNKVGLENCLNNPSIINNQFMGKSYCQKTFGATEYDPRCTLPSQMADGIEKLRTERNASCMTQAQQALY